MIFGIVLYGLGFLLLGKFEGEGEKDLEKFVVSLLLLAAGVILILLNYSSTEVLPA